jgi:hypothetical protein
MNAKQRRTEKRIGEKIADELHAYLMIGGLELMRAKAEIARRQYGYAAVKWAEEIVRATPGYVAAKNEFYAQQYKHMAASIPAPGATVKWKMFDEDATLGRLGYGKVITCGFDSWEG